MVRSFGMLMMFVALTALPSVAAAQSDDAVVVLFHGGVDAVPVFDLSEATGSEVVRLGMRRIIPADVGPVRVSDIKVLPDGSYLLADVNARGAVVSTPDGESFRWVLDEQQDALDIDAATVASYFAPGEPSLVAIADSIQSSVTIRSLTTPGAVWFENFRLTASRGEIPQVSVMPMNRVAVALNWRSVGVSGVELRDTSDPTDEGTTILSEAHAEAPSDAVIVDELDIIRDMIGLTDGRYIVTTRVGIVVLASDGTLDRTIGLGDLPGVSGELASVRPLPSGNWAIASFQPGEWVEPDTNHRVHWFDPETSEVLATSEPLLRAPRRVEPVAGHGGTGTLGFVGGLDDIQQGDPTDVELVRLEIPSSVRVGDAIAVKATVENTGAFPVGLSTLTIRGAVGTCSAAPIAAHDFAVARSVALSPDAVFTFANEEEIDGRFELGPWCAFVQGLDQGGRLHSFGDPVEFEVLGRGTNAGSTIDVTRLPSSADDVGVDAGGADADMGAAGPEPQPDGCCATFPRRRRGHAVLLLFALAFGFVSAARPWAAGRARP